MIKKRAKMKNSKKVIVSILFIFVASSSANV